MPHRWLQEPLKKGLPTRGSRRHAGDGGAEAPVAVVPPIGEPVPEVDAAQDRCGDCSQPTVPAMARGFLLRQCPKANTPAPSTAFDERNLPWKRKRDHEVTPDIRGGGGPRGERPARRPLPPPAYRRPATGSVPVGCTTGSWKAARPEGAASLALCWSLAAVVASGRPQSGQHLLHRHDGLPGRRDHRPGVCLGGCGLQGGTGVRLSCDDPGPIGALACVHRLRSAAYRCSPSSRGAHRPPTARASALRRLRPDRRGANPPARVAARDTARTTLGSRSSPWPASAPPRVSQPPGS